jgi:hypothetical protein
VRVIVSCVPQTGHLVPLLPLAEAFSAQGDEVTVASGPDAEAVATSRGLGFRAVGPGFDAWFDALGRRTRGLPGDGLAPERVESYFVPRLFAEIGTSFMVDDLLKLCEELEPELLVFDPYVFAAPLVAELTGTASVLHNIGALMSVDVLELASDAVSPIWREFGISVPEAAGVFAGTTLAICPYSLDPNVIDLARVRPLRPVPVPLASPFALPVSFPDPARPLVYVTLGTFSNNDLDLFRLILAALDHEPVNVLATIGRDNDPVALAPLPDNARVARFIPQAELLPHCSVVVHHAGAGTTFGVLAHGLPAVAVPQSADNFVMAGRLATSGAARTLMPSEVTADAVRSAVRVALEDPECRYQAQLLAGEIAGMPPPGEVAADLGT